MAIERIYSELVEQVAQSEDVTEALQSLEQQIYTYPNVVDLQYQVKESPSGSKIDIAIMLTCETSSGSFDLIILQIGRSIWEWAIFALERAIEIAKENPRTEINLCFDYGQNCTGIHGVPRDLSMVRDALKLTKELLDYEALGKVIVFNLAESSSFGLEATINSIIGILSSLKSIVGNWGALQKKIVVMDEAYNPEIEG